MFTLSDTKAQGVSLFDFPAPAGSVISGAFDDAVETNSVPMYMLSRELSAARERGARLEAPLARQRAQAVGVTVAVPEDGITQEALAILIERRKDDAARSQLMARSPGGFAVGLGELGAGMAGAMLDPLNVAAGFLPILGGTRFAVAAMGGSFASRLGQRLAVGAAEGAVGAAAVEVPTLALRRDLQDDYSLYDSLANVAFGTAASAGIRGVTGAAKDAWQGIRHLREQQAEAIEREAVAIERSMVQDLEAGTARGAGIPAEMAAEFENLRAGREFGEAMAEEGAERASRTADFLRLADEAIERRVARLRDEELARGLDPDEALLAAVRKATEEGRARPLLSQAEIGARRLDELSLEEARGRIARGEGLVITPEGARAQLAAISDATHAQALKAAVAQAIEGRRIDVDGVVRQDPIFGQQRLGERAVREKARQNMAPESKVGADRAASQRAAEGLQKAVKVNPPKEAKAEAKSPELVEAEALLAETRAMVDAKAKAAGVEVAKSEQDFMAKIEAYAKAWEALATCAEGKGL